MPMQTSNIYLYSLAGTYGVYMDRASSYTDSVYTQAVFLMTMAVEVLMYTLGASFPGKNHY